MKTKQSTEREEGSKLVDKITGKKCECRVRDREKEG